MSCKDFKKFKLSTIFWSF